MKKIGLLFTVTAMVLAFSGCGTTSNNLGGAIDGDDRRGNYSDNGYNGTYSGGEYENRGAAYWDGYGINSGRDMYNHDSKLGSDMRDLGDGIADAGRDVGNGAKDMFDGDTTAILD